MVGPRVTEQIQRLYESGPIFVNRSRRWISNPLRSRRGQSPLTRFHAPGHQTWFGYYDITPFDRTGSRILAMVGERFARTPKPGDIIQVGYFDVSDTTSFYSLSSTTTWCWQQGCRLRWWHPAAGEPERILFNRLVDGRYGSSVVDPISGSVMQDFDFPIYDVDLQGKRAVTLNFSRLQRLRPGYGYVNSPDSSALDRCPDQDGIWDFDLSGGERRLLVSLRDLRNIEPSPSMVDAEHYVNHLSYSPSGTKLLFFHLWTREGERFNRMMTIDCDGQNLKVIHDVGLVSHFAWRNDDIVLATVYHGGRFTYNVFDLHSRKMRAFGENILTVDGHPSYAADGTTILTDTYADRFGEQHLLLYHPEKGSRNLGRYYAPVRFRGEWRCDLHPRWDQTRRRIAFDSTHDGWRSLYVIDLDEQPLDLVHG